MPLHIATLQEVRERELFESRGAPRHCTSPVQPDQSGSRAPPSRGDRCFTPSFLVHAAHFVVLRHDVLQHRTSDVSLASPAMCTTSHTSLLPSKSTSTSRRIASSITSRLALVSHLTSKTEWSPRRDHQPARTWLRTDVTPRLHLLEGSNTYGQTAATNSACCICLISITFVTLSSSAGIDFRMA